jgi:cytochrome c biogenesis protein CcmG/thiol:disulfide interchange protein DsbE
MDANEEGNAMGFSYSTTSDASWSLARLALLAADGAEWQPNVDTAFARCAERTRNRNRSGIGWISAAAVAAALCVFALTYPSPAALAHRCLECSLAVLQSLTPSKKTEPALAAASSRMLAPDFTLADSSGAPVRLSDFRGKVVLVNFWATWCHGCQLEIPWLVEFQKELGGKGLAVVGVSTDDDGWKSVRPWMKDRAINYAIVIGDEALTKKYGVTEMPVTALVDRNGRIAELHSGVIDRADMRRKIDILLREPQTPRLPY